MYEVLYLNLRRIIWTSLLNAPTNLFKVHKQLNNGFTFQSRNAKKKIINIIIETFLPKEEILELSSFRVIEMLELSVIRFFLSYRVIEMLELSSI